mmetsp:Transcript_5139/g.18031  ORF Transcript_5139/g.18031 Transcript_5139/m.18031 type:complete len:233 (-) Transcript_5139:185-883(-)
MGPRLELGPPWGGLGWRPRRKMTAGCSLPRCSAPPRPSPRPGSAPGRRTLPRKGRTCPPPRPYLESTGLNQKSCWAATCSCGAPASSGTCRPRHPPSWTPSSRPYRPASGPTSSQTRSSGSCRWACFPPLPWTAGWRPKTGSPRWGSTARPARLASPPSPAAPPPPSSTRGRSPRTLPLPRSPAPEQSWTWRRSLPPPSWAANARRRPRASASGRCPRRSQALASGQAGPPG